jgi:hypothetical protein
MAIIEISHFEACSAFVRYTPAIICGRWINSFYRLPTFKGCQLLFLAGKPTHLP